MAIYLPKSNFTRFAFYSSLNTYPNVSANDPNYTSAEAYNMAIDYLNQGLSKLIEEDESSAYKQALNLIKKMADNELNKEQKLLLSKINDESLPLEIREIIKKTCVLENFNYENFIRALNAYYLKAKDLTSKIDSSIEDMKTISDALKKAYSRYRNFKGNEQVKLKRRTLQLMNTGTNIEYLYGDKKKGKRSRVSKDTFLQFQTAQKNLEKSQLSLADLDKKAYNELSQKVVECLNQAHKEDIYSIISGNAVAKDNVIKVLDYLTLLFFQDYVNKINAEARKNAGGTANFKFREISEILNEADPKAEEEFIKSVNEAYSFFSKNIDLVQNLAEDLFGQTLSYNRVIQLRKEILEEARKLSNEIGIAGKDSVITSKNAFSTTNSSRWKKAKEKAMLQGEEALQKFNQIQQLSYKFSEISSATRLKSGKRGALAVGAERAQALESGFQNTVIRSFHKGGANAKDDTLTFHLYYTPPEFDASFKNKASQKLDQAIDDAMDQILDIANSGAMDNKSLKKRLAAQDKIYKELEEELKKIQEEANLDKDSLNLFIEHGTTKEYTFLNNDLGFRAGELGANGEVISAIENIQLMAHKGGISFVDKNWLIFAVINCARHLVGAEINIQPSLENYLSLIAGALMFEDSNKIMLEVNEKIKNNTPGILGHIHLYRLNSFYFPLSFILYKTWEDLSSLENFLEDAKHSGNQVHIQNNAGWKLFESPVLKKTWKEEGKYTLGATTIKMTFMAGFLDILENLKITAP